MAYEVFVTRARVVLRLVGATGIHFMPFNVKWRTPDQNETVDDGVNFRYL